MLVFNEAKKLFLGQRYKEPDVWQFPQGGVEADVSLEQNVLRELREELGAPEDTFLIVKKLKSTHTYEFSKVPKYAVGKWRGQTQTFWLVQFAGKNSEIKLDLHEPEFMDWKWCTPEDVRVMADPKRLPGYENPLREYAEFLKKG